jgi:hypothetical protein
MHFLAQLPPDAWIIAMILIGAVVLGAVMALATAQVRGGWSSFAKHYRAKRRPDGGVHNVISCWILKLHSTGGGLQVIFSDEGIYLYKTFPFRIGSPPLLVPWKSVKSVQKGQGLFGEYYIVEVEDAAGSFLLNLPKTIENDLSKYYQLS